MNIVFNKDDTLKRRICDISKGATIISNGRLYIVTSEKDSEGGYIKCVSLPDGDLIAINPNWEVYIADTELKVLTNELFLFGDWLDVYKK